MTKANTKHRRNALAVLAGIHRRTLPDGSRIGEIPVTGDRPAVIDAADLDRLLDIGLHPVWHLNGANGFRYVRARFSVGHLAPNKVQVARAIMEPLPGFIVKHLDGDRLNLRRANLVCVKGVSQAKARERFFDQLPIAAE
jgi:hypothetical protein